jgi:hypothetical protein
LDVLGADFEDFGAEKDGGAMRQNMSMEKIEMKNRFLVVSIFFILQTSLFMICF